MADGQRRSATRRRRLGRAGAAAVALLAAGAPVGAAAPMPAASTPRDASGVASIHVEAARGRLSVALREAPLDAVLDAIRRETRVRLRTYGPLARLVSDRFDRLPVEAGLRRLLRTASVAFVYVPARGAGPPRLSEIVVYPSGGQAVASARQPTAPASGAGNRVPASGAAKADTPAVTRREGIPPDVQQRLARLEAAGARAGDAGDQAAAAELAHLLSDPSPDVRLRVLEVAEATRLVPADTLRSLVLRDPDREVRRGAVAALLETAGAEAATAAATAALSDSSPAVRLAALEALAEQIGGKAGESAARTALDDADPEVRTKAAEVLGIYDEGPRPGVSDERDADEERGDAVEETPGQSGHSGRERGG